MTAQLPFMPWKQFLDKWNWKQGEHVLVIGRTGQGKTTLISKIVDRRKHVVMFATKVHDPVLAKQFPDFKIKNDWSKIEHDKIMLWVKSKDTLREIKNQQADVFRDAMDTIFHDRGWCLVIDEAHWITSELGLGQELAMFQHQARSSGISVVTGVQRPAFIPVITYGSTTHAFMGRINEPTDLRRLSGLGGVDAKELGKHLLTLPKHEWVYVDNTGNMPPVRTRIDMSER
jgi:predicted ATPase